MTRYALLVWQPNVPESRKELDDLTRTSFHIMQFILTKLYQLIACTFTFKVYSFSVFFITKMRLYYLFQLIYRPISVLQIIITNRYISNTFTVCPSRAKADGDPIGSSKGTNGVAWLQWKMVGPTWTEPLPTLSSTVQWSGRKAAETWMAQGSIWDIWSGRPF